MSVRYGPLPKRTQRRFVRDPDVLGRPVRDASPAKAARR